MKVNVKVNAGGPKVTIDPESVSMYASVVAMTETEHLEMMFLTSGECKVVKLLQSKAPQIVTYREIYEIFSHPTTIFQSSTVQRLVSRIRCKMHTDRIKNVMTIGYYWDENA